MAEREGFEPPEACASTVFKTAAFDRSATSPRRASIPDLGVSGHVTAGFILNENSGILNAEPWTD
jgi:hypothetical protein